MSTETGIPLYDDLSEQTIDRIKRWYQVPALLLTFVFMLWARSQAWQKFIKSDSVYFSGNDPWYHYRQVLYTVRNWPETMPYDVWTGYPYGVNSGQFGTLYDQIVATVALVVGMGNPSDYTVGAVLVFAPVVAAAFCVIPVYYIGKRLSNKHVGVMSAVILSLFTGIFFRRGLVGVADHNIVEPLFMGTAVALLMYSTYHVSQRIPVVDMLKSGDEDEFGGALVPSFFAGVAVAMYMWVWPPGVLLVVIFGVFLVVNAIVEVYKKRPVEPVLLGGAMSMSATAIFMAPVANMEFSPTSLSLLQVLAPIGIAAGSLFMVGMYRMMESRTESIHSYPVAVVGTIGVVLTAFALALPQYWSVLMTNAQRVVGLGTSAGTRTIGEAQPWFARSNFVQATMGEYGIFFYIALIGFFVLLYKMIRGKARSQHVLLVVWSVFLFMAAATQVRFNYYLAIPVAVFAGYGIWWTLSMAQVQNVKSTSDIDGWQALTVLTLVIAIVIAGPLYPVAATPAGQGQYNGVGAYQQWENSFDWMEGNTPQEGNYGGAGNASQMDYYGSYEYQQDFDYPDGSYGVMSWWDYGHWITVGAERIPVANPFQQNANEAANWLLADSESEAENIVTEMDEGDNSVRYAMIDWKMVTPTSKFGAPVVFHDNISRNEVLMPLYTMNQESGRPQYIGQTQKQRYYESMMVRLYAYHGSAKMPEPVVLDYETSRVETRTGQTRSIPVAPQDGKLVKRFGNMSQAEDYVRRDGSARIGGFGLLPSEKVDALEHYRLVHANDKSALRGRGYNQYVKSQVRISQKQVRANNLFNNPTWVKTFERVEGATISGTGPTNATVEASVEMKIPSTGENFTYTQYTETGADGEWNMTVPYSTTGYDEFGPEDGYTNPSVKATGPYVVSVLNGDSQTTVNVTEGQVIGEDKKASSTSLQ